MPSESFKLGIQQFNQEQFYECHDTLEAIWIEAPETDKRFYQGILQVAVACHHLSNYNLRGAIILLGEAVRRLCDYQPDHHGIDVEQILEESSFLLQTLQQLDPDNLEAFVDRLFSPTKAAKSEENKAYKLPKLVTISSNSE